MFRKIDCLLLRVPDLKVALAFYRDRLGHVPAWHLDGTAAGLKMAGSDSELVLI
jgi:catechol 2,3-dioxygenase-like lactoylglutathione lyase family enzyme